jgi:hypothetical protein
MLGKHYFKIQEYRMKKIIVALLAMSSITAFAQLPVVGSELTDYGARVEIRYDRSCFFVGPACVSYAHKWKKEVKCESSSGKFVAKMNIERTVKAYQVEAAESSIKKIKIKLEGLCNGRTPEGLDVNGVTIL